MLKVPVKKIIHQLQILNYNYEIKSKILIMTPQSIIFSDVAEIGFHKFALKS